MAGEIEEPFRFNFQADLLHSGSISFGRFESESLSWERRSSFSHNRYLEEVEKYSIPGSVTEKKAYFEAHFRRKALLKQSSSDSQDGREFPTVENDDPHDVQESDIVNESKQFTCSDESPHSSGHFKYDEETETQKWLKENVETLCAENANASSHFISFDESICNLENEGVEILECEREDTGNFFVAPNGESMINNLDHMVTGLEDTKLEESHQIGSANVVLVINEENIKTTVNDTVGAVGVTPEANDSFHTSITTDKDDDKANSGTQQMLSFKVRPASEMKQPKSKLKAHANFDHARRMVFSEPLNGSAKGKTRESKGLLMKDKEKKSPRPASPIAYPGRKTSKSEEPSTSFPKAKLLPLNKSIVKEYISVKTLETKSSVLDKSIPGAHQTANRTKRTIITPSKPHITQSAAGFTFKSDQRAERRKEEKRAAAEITQPQKNLNFKATPLPSFYKESACCSDQSKVIVTSKTPNRPRTASMAPSTKTFPSKSTNSSSSRPSSSTSLTNRNRPSEPSKNAQEKKKNLNLQKQGPRARDTRGVRTGSGTRLGYLAVGVAT